jgi:hypothetical protein
MIEGLEQAPSAFIGLMKSEAFGKRIIHLNGIVDLSRFSAAPRARLSHLAFESDGAFPTQC